MTTYRQTVLTAFQQVEDALAAERTTDYLTVITAQSTLLSAQRTQVDLLTSRLTASVQLVVSLGGRWDVSSLPSTHDVKTRSLR